MSDSERQKNVQITIPNMTFKVEDGLPELPTTGRTGESKYSSLIETARGLKPGSHFKVPVSDPTLQKAFIRNLRVAIKRFAPKLDLKVTASGKDAVSVYKDIPEPTTKASRK